MKTTNINTTLLDNYFGLIRNLSPEIKLGLIEKIKKTLGNDKTSLSEAFGAWKSKKSADDIILELRENRKFNRTIESL